ncbi:MAG: C_GCAxxG_C_C family protein [Deltaproteobacteria bacterium]|nr:C_GCAxxG_C_C family protein [Deltaproteobacteria bacterium]
MTPAPPHDIRRRAEELFTSGLYCAESVLLALAESLNIKSDLIPKVATGFCSGLSRTCGPCGALTGGIMGLGLSLGRTGHARDVNSMYAATQGLVRAFESEFGSRDCRVLLGCDLGTVEGQAFFRANKLGEKCLVFTGRTAEMAAQILDETAHGSHRLPSGS